jgi:glycosyltransferase involved in cell wall biosynthesis
MKASKRREETQLSEVASLGMKERPSAVHQFVADLIDGDAVGEHAKATQRVLRARGVRSEIFVERLQAGQEGQACHFSSYPSLAQSTDVCVYHLTGSSELAEFLMHMPGQLVVYYHNVTPSELLAPWVPNAAWAASWARFQLRRLAKRALLGLAPSRYSLDELEGVGFRRSHLAPLIGWHAPPLDDIEVPARRDLPVWLFVGRISPHKRQHLLIEALVVAERSLGVRARLELVGRSEPPSYLDAIVRLAEKLGVGERVLISSGLSREELWRRYLGADCFVCASAHEGFCLPLLEAMAAGLPVVALDTSAVKETIAGAGLAVKGGAAELAVAASRVTRDACLRETLVARGRERLAGVGASEDEERLCRLLGIV